MMLMDAEKQSEHARGKALHIPCIEAAHLGSVSMLKLLSVTSVRHVQTFTSSRVGPRSGKEMHMTTIVPRSPPYICPQVNNGCSSWSKPLGTSKFERLVLWDTLSD